MIVTLSPEWSVDIRATDPHRHKYASAMAEYLDVKGMDCADEETGEVDAPMGHVARFGRRLLFTDDRGFVSVDTYPEERGARQVFDAIADCYSFWAFDDEDEEWTDSLRAAHSMRLAMWATYVVACATENLEAYGFADWWTRGRPAGPLG